MEQFNLEKWLQDKSRKVVTREGKPVRIVCWDSPNKGFPIVGFIDNNPIFIWDKYGYALSGHRESNRDLFFADEENELTEFENKLVEIIKGYCSINENGEYTQSCLKDDSKELLDLARKELEKEVGDKCWEAHLKGEEEALKDLPKWKKAKNDEELDCHVAIQQDDRVVLSDFVQKDEYYITLDVLKKLPKEE